MMTILIIFVMIFVLGPIAQAYAKRLNPPEVRGIRPGDVAKLREELEQLAAQVNRLQDEQSFMVNLLSDSERSTLKSQREHRRLPGHGPADGALPGDDRGGTSP